jgi:hypothetical protein
MASDWVIRSTSKRYNPVASAECIVFDKILTQGCPVWNNWGVEFYLNYVQAGRIL